jgi:cleavage and polyadenylation specificity factor subunit 1
VESVVSAHQKSQSRSSFEFASNEFINAVECVTLETSSTETGIKDFVAVGTTINRGEDLAAKGSVGLYHYPIISY